MVWFILSGHTCYAGLHLVATVWEVVYVYKDGMLHDGVYFVYHTKIFLYTYFQDTSYLI